MTFNGLHKYLKGMASTVGFHLIVVMGVSSAAAFIAQNANAQTNYCNRGVSNPALNAATARYLYDSYVLVSKRLLKAVIDDHLTNLGFRPTARDRKIAAAQLRYMENPTGSAQGAEDIIWSNINVTLRHPVHWFGSPKLLQLADARRACADYAARGICTGAGAVKSVLKWRAVGRSILNLSNSCSAKTLGRDEVPDRSRLKRSIARIHQLFMAKERFIWQYKFLQNLNNRPFRRNMPLDMLLYADFLKQSLENGSVTAFAGEYFNPSNPLEKRYPLQFTLRPLVGILISNRLLR